MEKIEYDELKKSNAYKCTLSDIEKLIQDGHHTIGDLKIAINEHMLDEDHEYIIHIDPVWKMLDLFSNVVFDQHQKRYIFDEPDLVYVRSE